MFMNEWRERETKKKLFFISNSIWTPFFYWIHWKCIFFTMVNTYGKTIETISLSKLSVFFFVEMHDYFAKRIYKYPLSFSHDLMFFRIQWIQFFFFSVFFSTYLNFNNTLVVTIEMVFYFIHGLQWSDFFFINLNIWHHFAAHCI